MKAYLTKTKGRKRDIFKLWIGDSKPAMSDGLWEWRSGVVSVPASMLDEQIKASTDYEKALEVELTMTVTK